MENLNENLLGKINKIYLENNYSIPLTGLIIRDRLLFIKNGINVKLSKILKYKDGVPDDLYFLFVKYHRLYKHLEINKKDYSNKRRITIVEGKIKCLLKYLKKKNKINLNFKYSIFFIEKLIRNRTINEI